MKIRTDYVTNSSSSSFVLTIYNIEKEDFINLLDDSFSVRKQDIEEELNRNLVALNDEIDSYKNSNRVDMGCFIDIVKSNRKEVLNDLARLDKITEQEDILTFFLERDTKLEYKDNDVIISGGITMFNSVDDLPNTLKCLVLKLVLDGRYKFKCENKED